MLDVNGYLCAFSCQNGMVIKKTIAMEKTGAISKQVVHKIIIRKIEQQEAKKKRAIFCSLAVNMDQPSFLCTTLYA